MYVHYSEMHSFIFDRQEVKGIIKHAYHTVHCNNKYIFSNYLHTWLVASLPLFM